MFQVEPKPFTIKTDFLKNGKEFSVPNLTKYVVKYISSIHTSSVLQPER